MATARLRRKKFAEDDKDDISLYDIEFGKGPIGIQFETNFYGDHAVVKHVVEGGAASKVLKQIGDKTSSSAALCIVEEGHVLVAVNGRDVSKEPFKTVMQAIKDAPVPRILRFLDPNVLALEDMNQHATEQLLNRCVVVPNCPLVVMIVRDHYGFAKDDSYILKYRKQMRLKKAQHNTYAVEKEWADFLQSIGGTQALNHRYNQSGEKTELQAQLEPLVLHGIPTAFRASVWGVLTNVQAYKESYAPTYYTDILSGELRSSTLEDIEKDVGRTYPEHAYFQQEKGKQELTNVLVAYSVHNATIGYCQSMNFLVGILLLFLTEEESFWLLCVMMEHYLPTENYSRSMLGSQVDQVVFKRLVNLQLPHLGRAFEDAGIEIELVTLQWFLCVFVCTLPLETALRVWDYMFLHGEEVLFSVALGILKSAEDKIIEASTSHSLLFMLVRELGFDLHNADAFMEQLVAFHHAPAEEGGANDDGAAEKPNPIDFLVQKFNEISIKLRKGSIVSAVDDTSSSKKRFTYGTIQQWRSEVRPQIEAKEKRMHNEKHG
ncbi:Aste57867_14777 [Aphanomyces stellatus]|uniref:Aste57867_14777 protein n=1 Tax=Aphanomyces stellatus TaxID=120398 RepID=A0A485L1K9_9STRA|nr:hypothetical protein As57867_014722 [Aphanomyces stellatus]VFT91595.1 Aste57867_14777 [Aphanomyces stellatus]